MNGFYLRLTTTRYRRKANIRLESFVTGRSQQFVVNGSASSWSPVVFGVTQRTLLRPILFLMFMNDLATNIIPSIKLFATTVFFTLTVRLIPLAIMLLSTARPRSINQSINKLYLPSNLQCSTQVLISSSQLH